MSAEDINNIPESTASESAPASSQPAAATPAAAQSTPAITQAQMNQMAQEALNGNQLFQQFQKFNQFSNQEQKPKSPFEQGIGFENITDAAQFLHQEQAAAQRELAEVRQETQYIKQYQAQEQFDKRLNALSGYWSDKYDGDESFQNAAMEAINMNPRLAQKYQEAERAGGLTADFVADLHQSMVNLWQFKLDDPNSGVLDSLVKQAAKRKALQNQSMLSSNTQTTDSGKTHDKFSSRLIIYGDE